MIARPPGAGEGPITPGTVLAAGAQSPGRRVVEWRLVSARSP